MPGAVGDVPAMVAGRYALHRRVASGGMASVYYGRLFGAAGFSRVVAIKRLHPQYATDSLFRSALLDEARLVSRIRHPNVVPVLDVVADGDELLVVMEYVHGEKLSTLFRLSADRGQPVPLGVVTALISDTLRGLHAAHEARAADGELLGMVHRDVSPQNVLVSAEGSALVADFGIAKAIGRSQTTRDGQLKGKLAYMAYEQLTGGEVTRRTDVWATAAVAWEALTLQRLFAGDSDGEVYSKVMQHVVPPPSDVVSGIPKALETIVMKGLDRDPELRYATALEMAEQLERVVPPAPRAEVARWLSSLADEILEKRAREIEAAERMEVEVPSAASAPRLPPAEPALPAPAHELSKGAWQLNSVKQSRASKVGIVVLGLGVVALAIWFFLGRTPRAEPEAVAPAPVVASEAPSATVTAVAAPVSVSAPAPSASVKPVIAAPRVQNKRPTKSKTTAGCRVLGKDGIWHIRPGCL